MTGLFIKRVALLGGILDYIHYYACHAYMYIIRFYYYCNNIILYICMTHVIYDNLKCDMYVFGIADLTRIAQKKLGHSWTSLIKVEGLFSSYIVTHFDIVNSQSLV